MINPKLAVIAAVLWAGGFAGAAALAQVVNPHSPATAEVERATPEALRVPFARAVPERYIVLPTIEIVSHVSRPVAAAPPPHQRDISEMHCSPWRPLEQGSNSVQICE